MVYLRFGERYVTAGSQHEDIGLTNVHVMGPFMRTVGEARAVTTLLADRGLQLGQTGLKIIMTCKIPSNALLAEDFLEYFESMSTGSKELSHLTPGLDRDSANVSELFDERNASVKMHFPDQPHRGPGRGEMRWTG